MPHMLPENYFPCLAPIEQEACRLFYENIPPGYFVCPTGVIDAYYAGACPEWPTRVDVWANMFRFHRVTIEVFGVEIEVFTDGENFQLDWLIYPPISHREAPPVCRQFIYSDV